jgi:hypothetical protein
MRNLTVKLFLLVFVVLLSAQMKAQDVASITGVVTDQTGAVIPGVNITLVNTLTNTSYQAETNAVGSYTIPNVLPGPGYKITFAHGGFNSDVITDLYLNVANTRTQNARMTVGGASQTVQVSVAATETTLDTTDATVGNNFEVGLINEVPVYNRNTPAILFSLQPGVTTSLSVTGARVDQSTVTLDGLDVNDIASGATFAIVARAPVDSVQEYRGTVAGNLAGNGTGGGGQFQLVTKSGTNSFHGNLNEYHRDTSTVANTWFNKNSHIARAPLIQNQFGGNIGGPIKRNKLFFFFDDNNSRIVSSSQQNRTVPLDSLRNGSVSYIRNVDSVSGATCAASSRQNTTPTCIGSMTSAQAVAAGLDPKNVGYSTVLLAFINTRYPHANDLTAGDGINTGYYRFNAPSPDDETDYVGRVDYTMRDSMKIFGRFNMTRRNATQAAVQFLGDPVTSPYVDRSYAYVVGHTWAIGAHKVNEFVYGDTISKYDFANTYDPAGTTVFTFGGGTTALMTAPYTSPSSQKRRVPIPMLRDDFNWQIKNHNLQFGGTFKFIKTNSNLVNDFNFTSVGLGGKTMNLSSALRPSNIRTAGTTAASTYDNAYTFALGRVGAITSNYNYDNKGHVLDQGSGETRRYRYYETELYFGDTWKLNSQLTLSYGARYQLYTVPYEANGNESVQNQTFDEYFADRMKQSAAGVSGDSSLPFLTYTLGGKANNGPNLYKPSYKDFGPRFAFAYTPSFDHKLVINGGAGIQYDRTVINAVNFIQDQSSYLFQNSAARSYGVTSPVTSLLNDPRLGASLSIPAPPTAPAIGIPYIPFVSGGTPHGLADNEFDSVVDPNLKDPYSIMLNAGIQRELPQNFIVKVNYVGRLGRRLLAQADASQLVDFPDATSGQMMSTAFGNMTTAVRNGATYSTITAQPWMEHVVYPGIGVMNGYTSNTAMITDYLSSLISYGDFADSMQWLAANGLIDSNVAMASQFAGNTFITNKGSSNYHGLLATVTKNMSHGLQFDFNYTWSHSIDNVSAVANFIASGNGYGFLCDARNNRTCRASSDFDQRHVISSEARYDLPVGKNRAFMSDAPRWLDEIIGGWGIAAITTWRSGLAYTVYTDAYVAGYANNAPATFIGSNRSVIAAHPHRTTTGAVTMYTDPTAALNSFAGPVGFNIGNRNFLRGPTAFSLDSGLAKTFPLWKDKVNLKFRADTYNTLNHPVFSTPSANSITLANFGQVTTTASSARVAQFSLRLEF